MSPIRTATGQQDELWTALAEGAVRLQFPTAETQYSLHRIADSPCHATCPAGVDVKGYVGLIAQRRFQEAVDLVRVRCPLPGICGRVCTHPCELSCQRSEEDEPVAIRLLKRFAADWELAHPAAPPRPARRLHEEKVAVIGAGPAGLAAAFDLVREGYGVTVFEAAEEAGGMLNQCIPAFRLPREVISHELNYIRQLGVEFCTDTTFGRDLSLGELRERGYGAVLLAMGAQLGKRLDVPGETGNLGVFDCVQFLRMIEQQMPLPAGKRLLVVGGGMSAMDAARVGVRLGLDVTVVYRRTRSEMPAVIDEVQDAEREGVKFQFLAAPTEVTGSNGRVTGMKCQRMKLVTADESGRPRPVPIRGDFFTLPAELIVTAISQEADFTPLAKEGDFTRTRWGSLDADADSLGTGMEGVFAAGDLVLGPDTVIGAMAQGHRAASSIHAYLRGYPLPMPLPAARELGVLPRPPRKQPRARQEVLALDERMSSKEVEFGFDLEAAVAEAQRCLRCGPCHECGSCADDCRHRVTLLRPADVTQGRTPAATLLRVPVDTEEFPLLFEPRPVTLSWWHKRGGRLQESKSEWEISPLLCTVEERMCRGCGDCVKVCPYDAIRVMTLPGGDIVARVFQEFCKGCGSCAAVCPTGAMIADHYEHDGILKAIRGHMTLDAPRGEPRVLLLACNWCFSQPSVLQGLLPPGTRLLDNLCSGRLHPAFVLEAFEAGADGVMVAACGEGECHYRSGNQTMMGQVARLQGMLGLMGMDTARFELRLFKRADSASLPMAVERFVAGLRRAGPLTLDPVPTLEEVTQ